MGFKLKNLIKTGATLAAAYFTGGASLAAGVAAAGAISEQQRKAQSTIASGNLLAQQNAWNAESQAALASGNAQARAAADAQAQAAARAAAERAAADAASTPVAATEVQAGGQALTTQAVRRKKAQFGRGGSTASISI